MTFLTTPVSRLFDVRETFNCTGSDRKVMLPNFSGPTVNNGWTHLFLLFNRIAKVDNFFKFYRNNITGTVAAFSNSFFFAYTSRLSELLVCFTNIYIDNTCQQTRCLFGDSSAIIQVNKSKKRCRLKIVQFAISSHTWQHCTRQSSLVVGAVSAGLPY